MDIPGIAPEFTAAQGDPRPGKSRENMEWAAGIPVCGRNWETNPKSTQTQGENPDSQFIGCTQERSRLFPWNYSKHGAWSLGKSGFGSQGISLSPPTQNQGKAELKSNTNQSNPIFSI